MTTDSTPLQSPRPRRRHSSPAACSSARRAPARAPRGRSAGASTAPAVTQGGTLNIDFATYNPLSLVIKQQGWLEAALADQGITVNWVQSAGSNKANEALRAGAIDVGSTAGSAALLARSNGSPIQVIDLYSQPEWAAIVVPAGSTIASVADLKGKNIAATKGTDPYFFLLQALEEAGVAQRRDRPEPPARRRLGGPPERLRRCVGGPRSDHGRCGGSRRDAPLPQRRLQQLRLPQRHRVVPQGRSRTSRRPSSTPTRRPAPGPSHPEETAAMLAGWPGWTSPSRPRSSPSAPTSTSTRSPAGPRSTCSPRSAPSSWSRATCKTRT